MDPYDFDDNASVGSLAFTDDVVGGIGNGGGGGGSGSGRGSSNHGSDHSSNHNGDPDHLDEDKDSPHGMVKQKMDRIRIVFFVCLLVGGVFLACAAYLTACPACNQNGGLYAGIVGLIYGVQLVVFLRYEYLVTKRGVILLDTAAQSRQIVDQLFPNFARDRLLQHNQQIRIGSSHHSDVSDGDDPIKLLENPPSGNNGSTDWQTLTKLNTLRNQQMAAAEGAGGRAAVIAKNQNKAPTQIRSFLSGGMSGLADNVGVVGDEDPIAELFPSTTVFFADIAGFTAWSSEREPTQVFRLLERVYGAFDSMAEKLRVFKVETIGDSYMCVTGLPEPDELHAINMARFAYQCLVKMHAVTEELSEVLGPGTEDLDVRIGLHSGPVTAGVLRGQKSRFQLFGDTVNTASRMESTGIKGRIQVSESTAKLLEAAGKAHWTQERMDRIVAKGKGEMRTFWLEPKRRTESHESSDDQDHAAMMMMEAGLSEHESVSRKGEVKKKCAPGTDNEIPTSGETITLTNMSRRLKSNYRKLAEQKHARLIDYNTNVLLKFVCAVIQDRGGPPLEAALSKSSSMREVNHDAETHELPPPFESVADVIILPDFDRNRMLQRDRYNVENNVDVECLRRDIRAFVVEIAALYQDVPFHNFEHASHVTLAMSKLLSRMTSGDHTDLELHLMTFGISSDPLTQLAMVLAALIHDVGHPGITNSQLVAEESPVALKYKEQSVVEQNSLCVAWAQLMQTKHKRLRSHIYKTNVERKRFRQVLINAVMATDIADRNVIIARARKWTLAFQDEEEEGDMAGGFGRGGVGGKAARTRDERNRRATVVIESLMQVADVAHTMQHWTIYRRWNEYLFQEMYVAYMNGRVAFDPTAIWYKVELAFLDHFVIPLARKIDESGVFGSSGDQYLSCAMANRKDWEQTGLSELKKMIEKARSIDPDTTTVDSKQQADYSQNHTPTSRSRSKCDDDNDRSPRSPSLVNRLKNLALESPRDEDPVDEESSTCTGFVVTPQGSEHGSRSFEASVDVDSTCSVLEENPLRTPPRTPSKDCRQQRDTVPMSIQQPSLPTLRDEPVSAAVAATTTDPQKFLIHRVDL